MRRSPALRGAESIALTVVATAALIVVSAYLLDRAGATFRPAVMLGIASGFAIAMFLKLGRASTWDPVETATFAGIVTLTFAWLIWIARPTYFPLGSGPDLTHHLLLIHYIETHWTLVHYPGAQQYLGEMVQYTPGSHILTALAGAWSRSHGLHVIHTVMAASVALKSGFVFLIAMRILPRQVARIPFAALAAISLFASQTYFLGSFTQYSFLAQVIAECFAVAMWWLLICWDHDRRRWSMAFAGLLGSAIFLTWPILIGPPLVVLGLLVVLPGGDVRLKPDTTYDGEKPDTSYGTEVRLRLVEASIAVAPIAIVAALFSLGRMNYLAIAGTGGDAVTPAVRAYGWGFLILSTIGILIALGDVTVRQSARTVALLAGAVLIQAAALYVYAHSRGNDPYMTRKMFYMLLYPQAVGVAVTVASVWRVVSPDEAGHGVPAGRPAKAGHYLLPWVVVVVAALFISRPLIGAPRSLIVAKHPATSPELEEAGEWVVGHVDPHCVEYLVGDDYSAYWLHLAVLGNPRRGQRSGDNATYELTPALVRWLTSGCLPYAIADLRVIPTDVRSNADILVQFGTVAVVKRRGPSSSGAG